jgi:PAS domain S-box-containing protein
MNRLLNSDFFAQLPLPAWQKDIDFNYVWANRDWVSFGRQDINWEGKNDQALFPPAVVNQLLIGDLHCMINGTSNEEVSIINSAGQEKILQIFRIPHFNAEGEPCGLSGIAIDKTYNTLLIQQLEYLMNDMDTQRDALHQNALIAITNQNGQYIYVSEKFCELTGYSRDELLTTTRYQLGFIPEKGFGDLLKSLFFTSSVRFDIHAKHKNGSDLWLQSLLVAMPNSNTSHATYYEISTDITAIKLHEEELEIQIKARTLEIEQKSTDLERRNTELIAQSEKINSMQHQLLQSDKMASIGQLAAGIAHEINNPIGYVNSNLGALGGHVSDLIALVDLYEQFIINNKLSDKNTDVIEFRKSIDFDYIREDLGALLSESKEGISRVKSIVQDLKDFSRLDSAQDWCAADLHAGINSTLNIVNNEIKYKAEIIREYGELPLVECVQSQLNQVFLNMLVNASHAIEQRGHIYIRTKTQGNEVCISISDTGKGISPENINRIFDPFFTTKAIGQGTGLGLSLSYGIVKKHHGRINVSSEYGQGATFDIWLPIKQTAESNANPS